MGTTANGTGLFGGVSVRVFLLGGVGDENVWSLESGDGRTAS